jgi:hypothetical protein
MPGAGKDTGPQRARYAGRKASASPATGLMKRHQAEQAALIAHALGHGVRDEIVAAHNKKEINSPQGANDMSTEVKVPTLGESIAEATLGQWLKQPGDAVAARRADCQP